VSSSFPTARFPALPLPRETSPDVPVSEGKDLTSAEVADEALIVQICAGDREALAVFFRRYSRLVHGIGRRVLRDHAETEDFVQDIFLYIHRKAGLYDAERGSVRTWIVQTSYYRALIRRSQLASRHYYGCVDPAEKEAEELADRTSPSYDRSGEGLFGRDGWRGLRSCLTEEQWETLRLHFYEGCTFAEIANQRNETIGNVRHHFYRGLDRLRKYLYHGELRKG
jgi:RNA polymerase sigma-70 factor (ECF subfamily)